MLRLACCLLPLLFALHAAAEPIAGSRPNIVLIITDDQGFGPVGRHGHPWIRTPNLDRLYDASTRFDRFLVSPTCSPTRSALMTGRHPMRNGVTHTILERERLTLDAVTLPQVLKKAGYTTAIFGKWHLGDEDPYQPQNRGFDQAFIHGAGGIGQAYDCRCADAPGNSYFDPVVRRNGTFVKTTGFCTDVFFAGALDWIAEVKDNDAPFFAYLATNAPHSPFVAPERFTQRFRELGFGDDQAGFYGMIENIDENVGWMLAALDHWQLLDDTLIIFMSDNGMAGGGSGRFGKPLGRTSDGTRLAPYNANMKGLKGSVDEGGVRVPLFVRWEGRIKPGRQIDRVAAHIDLMPTLIEIAGGELPADQVEGRSLVPLLEDEQADWPDRFLFTHTGRWPKDAPAKNYPWKSAAVRNERYRLVNNVELYDMHDDPGQTKNIIDHHPELVDQMRRAFDQWWTDTLPKMVNEDVPNADERPFHVNYQKQKTSAGIADWNPPKLPPRPMY